MDIQTLGREVRNRREAIGLTQDRLAKLADLPRGTVKRLEAGTIQDLGFQRVANLLRVLGLNFESPSLSARSRKQGLWMAAKTSSVSYRDELSIEMLERTLVTGKIPPGFEAHIGHLLDEAPVEVVVMAVEEAAQHKSVPPSEIWSRVSELAKDIGHFRNKLWV